MPCSVRPAVRFTPPPGAASLALSVARCCCCCRRHLRRCCRCCCCAANTSLPTMQLGNDSFIPFLMKGALTPGNRHLSLVLPPLLMLPLQALALCASSIAIAFVTAAVFRCWLCMLPLLAALWLRLLPAGLAANPDGGECAEFWAAAAGNTAVMVLMLLPLLANGLARGLGPSACGFGCWCFCNSLRCCCFCSLDCCPCCAVVASVGHIQSHAAAAGGGGGAADATTGAGAGADAAAATSCLAAATAAAVAQPLWQ